MASLTVNGQRVTVDDSFLRLSPEQQEATVNEIAASLGGSTTPAPEQAAAPQSVNVGQYSMSPAMAADPIYQAVFGDAPAPAASPEPAGLRPQVGWQGAGRGLADIAGAIVDLPTLALNALMAAGEIGGEFVGAQFMENDPDIQMPYIRNPIGGSDSIAWLASQAFEGLGGDIIEPQDMSDLERLFYNINRYGTEAAAGSTGFSRLAMARNLDPAVGPAPTPRFGDTFLRPYAGGNATHAFRGDVGAGAGMGVGITGAEEYFPDNPWAQLIAGIGGGFAGGLSTTAATAPLDIVQAVRGYGADPDIPYIPGTMTPTSRRAADAAAAFLQDAASNPEMAAATIARRQQSAQAHGDPMPTSGIMSDDIGLGGLEMAARNADSNPYFPHMRRDFMERDAALRQGVRDNISGLRDAGADQDAALQYAQNRPAQLAAEREASAMPLLRAAEARTSAAENPPTSLSDADLISTMFGEDIRRDFAPLYPAWLRLKERFAAGIATPDEISELDRLNQMVLGRGPGNDNVPTTPSINAQPVADLIDSMLAKAKRLAVRTALQQARAMLNAVGSDQLDTTVSGLYETRKAINDIINGRTDNATGRFAQQELIEVRKALDEQINAVAPELDRYLENFRQGSESINAMDDSQVVGRLMGEDRDLRNVAERLLSGSGYGGDTLMREVNAVVGSNPDAMRGWRAAVADVLADRVTNATTGEVSIARLNRVYDDNKEALAQVFSPEDMATLERTHEMFQPLLNLNQRPLPGSPTADNLVLKQALDAAILAYAQDAITAGMIMTRITRMGNLLANVLGLRHLTLRHQVDQVLSRVWFDPDLARHLLERPVGDPTGRAWNDKLQHLLGFGAAAREDSDEDEPSRLTIESDFGPATAIMR